LSEKCPGDLKAPKGLTNGKDLRVRYKWKMVQQKCRSGEAYGQNVLDKGPKGNLSKGKRCKWTTLEGK
jgi:hypothetical protein